MERIKNCQCKPNEPYCQLRETMCKIEKTFDHMEELNSQSSDIYKYDVIRGYDFEKTVDEAKKSIMTRVYSQEIKKISENIKIEDDEKDMAKLKIDISQMDFDDMLKKINDHYGIGKETIAFDQLLNSAKKLVSHWNLPERQKTKLILTHGDKDSIEALSKLTSVIVDGINPSEAVESSRLVESKVYVKDRVDVKFDNEVTAEKMRKVLTLL
jgi:hypothetical protein